MKFLIEYQCPQCGAPAELEETDRLFACPYCRVQSYLYHHKYFQYVLPSNAPKNKEIFYMPYWRFKGMIFSIIDRCIEHRFIDTSLLAIDSSLFPASVGLRSQALKLRFVTPDLQGYFVSPKLAFHNAMSRFMDRFNSAPPESIRHQTHIGETVSVIYSPFYADTKLYDAVLNKMIKNKLADDFNPLNFRGGTPRWDLNFLPILCPNCGWDMNGEKDSHALFCNNCDSAWIPFKNRFKRIDAVCAPARSDAHVYFPFWRIKADISDLSLVSYADLIRIANLPKVIQKGWDQIEFYFWIPGFKVQPKTFLRLLSHMTTAQPQDELHPRLPDRNIFPVTLPASEAIETLKINLASFIKNETFLDAVGECIIKPRNILLALLPFQEGHHDFTQPDYQISINKNQLALSGNL